MPYPVILGGDHAKFEQEWAASGRPDKERPDWPLPSFDARDWAEAFIKAATENGWLDKIDEEIMQTWFANALMRGFDEHAARSRYPLDPLNEDTEHGIDMRDHCPWWRRLWEALSSC